MTLDEYNGPIGYFGFSAEKKNLRFFTEVDFMDKA
jgi:hypothetical protein